VRQEGRRQARQREAASYVESHENAIRLKAEIMVDYFTSRCPPTRSAARRAMVVTSGIECALQYFHTIRVYLTERQSRYQAIFAFSGAHEYGGAKVTEASLN